MRIFRNLLRYTIGLPILLMESLMFIIGYGMAFILNEEKEWFILRTLKNIWKPLK